jgi:Pectinacetylesterase
VVAISWLFVGVAGLAGVGCSNQTAAGKGNPDGGAGVDAAPLPGTPGGWTWVDVPGMGCDDGSPTGVAVNPAPGGGGDLFIYFMGGGACWDASTCFVLNTSVHGPFGQAQWDGTGAPSVAHALDRARATNPFREMSYVFVPYCTGDLHAGSNIATYDVLGPRMFAHVGRRNVEALLPRLRATFAAPARVVIAGSSAGGYGATLNYDLIRSAYPAARAELVDDAGPLLEGDGIPADHRSAWYANWHLGDVVDPLCADCRADLSRLYPALVAKYPQDRMALLTSLQDQTIRTYFLILLGLDFEQRLRALVTDRLAPTATFRTFAIPGESHTLLGGVDTITSGGFTLEAWLAAMLAGDAAWASVGL